MANITDVCPNGASSAESDIQVVAQAPTFEVVKGLTENGHWWLYTIRIDEAHTSDELADARAFVPAAAVQVEVSLIEGSRYMDFVLYERLPA